MKLFPRYAAILALLVAPCWNGRVEAAAPVWKVTAPDGATLYLGGSIHALRKADHPLPQAFDRALANSARVIFEVEGEPSAALIKSGEYPKGDTLKNHVDPRTYSYLTKVFNRMGVPESKFSRYRPWLLTVMLMSPSLRGLSADLGVEGYVKQRARAAKKPTSGLVGVREHMSVFTGLTDRQSEGVLLLNFIPSTGDSYSSMVSTWKRGDAETAWRNTRAGFADYPAFGERILDARNRLWIPKIEGYLRSGQTCMVVVGLAHMGGPHGVLALLKARGYQIEQL